MEKPYINLKEKEKKNGEIEFTAEIPAEIIKKHTESAVAQAASDFEMPGFRKGKVPLHLVRPHLNEDYIFEDVIERSLREAVRAIVADEKLAILGIPQLNITEAKPECPVTFAVRFALIPDINLPDYKKIGKEIFGNEDDAEPTEKEIDDSIEEVKKMFAAANTPDGKELEKDAPLPELNEDLIKNFGNFKTVDEFKAELKLQLAQEKKMRSREAKREETIKKIVSETKMTLPKLLIDQEWRKATEDRAAHLEKAGLSFEDYLKQINKSEKDLEKEGRAFIDDQIKTSLVFREIQNREHIEASEKEIKANMNYLAARYKDRDPAWLRQTAEAFILQEKLFDLLSATEEKKNPEKAEI